MSAPASQDGLDTAPDPVATPKRLTLGEFIPLMAMLISLVALSIDAMLPALPAIGAGFNVTEANDTQLVIAAVFVGLGLGQLVYGPVSDSIGRKPAIYLGNVVFIIGCAVSITASSFEVMLLGRVLQGFGAAGNRTVIMAIVRDMYEGRMMAKIMSFIMAVFILVPAIAPALGQGILWIAAWEAIFIALLVFAGIATLWCALRLPESLSPENRKPFSARVVGTAFKTALLNRVTFGYTVATGFVFGPFLGYLASAQQIFQGPYGVGELFALYFASLVIATGAASIVNGNLVLRFGMRRLSRLAMAGVIIGSAIFTPVVLLTAGVPQIWSFMAYMMLIFFCVGMLFGNLNVMAMEPMGKLAGTAAALISALSTAISIPLGLAIGQAFDNTVTPLVVGFGICCLFSLFVSIWADKGNPPRPISF